VTFLSLNLEKEKKLECEIFYGVETKEHNIMDKLLVILTSKLERCSQLDRNNVTHVHVQKSPF
jgi:hypothetical protein